MRTLPGYMALLGRGKLTRSLSGPSLKGMFLEEDVPRGLAIKTKGDKDEDEDGKSCPEAAAEGPIMTTSDEEEEEEGLTNPRLTRRDNILPFFLPP